MKASTSITNELISNAKKCNRLCWCSYRTNIFIHKNLGKEVYCLILGLASVSMQKKKRGEKKNKNKGKEEKRGEIVNVLCTFYMCITLEFSLFIILALAFSTETIPTMWEHMHFKSDIRSQQGKQVSDTYSTDVYRILNN